MGNLDARRDWGHARDYVEGMWLMLQQEEPRDYVLATGNTHTVRSFCEMAFEAVGVSLRWEGEGVDEKGFDTRTGKCLIEVDSRYFRPAEVEALCGDASRARESLGWQPGCSLESMVDEMVEADLVEARQRELVQDT